MKLTKHSKRLYTLNSLSFYILINSLTKIYLCEFSNHDYGIDFFFLAISPKLAIFVELKIIQTQNLFIRWGCGMDKSWLKDKHSNDVKDRGVAKSFLISPQIRHGLPKRTTNSPRQHPTSPCKILPRGDTYAVLPPQWSVARTTHHPSPQQKETPAPAVPRKKNTKRRTSFIIYFLILLSLFPRFKKIIIKRK